MSKYRWLTEMSQQYLDRHYLVENQSVDHRISVVAETAESKLGINGFADKFKSYFQKGWYSLSTPIWANFGTDRGMPISCIVGDTWINTKENGGKQAKDIEIGDEVLTHKGRYRPITNIIVTEQRSDIYKLKVDTVDEIIYLTNDHLILTNSGWVRTDEIDSSDNLIAVNRLKDDFYVIEYCKIDIVEKTDKTETVYDFTVEEDHSFSASNIILHNCFGSYIEDSIESISSTWAEVCMQTKHGGGTSGYFGNVRCRGSKIRKNGESSGSVHFMKLFESLINIISQGNTRRGNFAAYLPVEHPDIMEFLTLHSDISDIKKLSFGITITDAWMQSMIDGDKDKRKIWAKVLEVRSSTGFPYLVFIDNANKNTVDVYKDKEMKIHHSNLCTEIFLPNNNEESFVCDLSSMNALYFDEWKDTDAVETMTFFLDAVMSEFIEKAREIKFMDRCVRFAERHRAIGIGVFGWHSYLQSKMIAFESMEAKMHNIILFKAINEQAHEASKKLANLLGEPEVLKGYGRRNTTLTAVAPTKSSSFIIGQASEGIEPNRTNYYIKDLQKGKYSIKNEYLEKLLIEKGQNNEEVWQSILIRNGSVQHLDFLSQEEKDVFKTFEEISQLEVISQATDRQKFIDQGQSVNLLIHPQTPVKEINALIIESWKRGIKSLYYQHSINAAQDFSRSLMTCKSCEG